MFWKSKHKELENELVKDVHDLTVSYYYLLEELMHLKKLYNIKCSHRNLTYWYDCNGVRRWKCLNPICKVEGTDASWSYHIPE
jgi:hypothetical protein